MKFVSFFQNPHTCLSSVLYFKKNLLGHNKQHENYLYYNFHLFIRNEGVWERSERSGDCQ